MEKTIKKITLVVALMVVMVLGLVSLSPADPVAPNAVGTPDSTKMDVFKVVLTKIELSSDGGSNWTQVWTGASSLNLALANVGEKAGNFAAGISVAAGTYNAYRISFTEDVYIQGVVHLAAPSGGLLAGYYYTKSSIVPPLQPLLVLGAGRADTEALARAAVDFGTYRFPSSPNLVKTGVLDLTVTVGGSYYFQINFNLAGKLGLYEIVARNGGSSANIYPIELTDSDYVITY